MKNWFLHLLLALSTLALAPAALASPLSLDASLRNKTLDARAGDTSLRITVKAAPVHLDTRMPMNLAVVIDRSGSMAQQGPSHTEKMADARASAQFLVDQLDERDTLTVISFDDGAEVLTPAARMTASAKAQAKARIATLYARGSTDMIAGLRAGIASVKERRSGEQVNRVMVISDGEPNTADGLVEMARAAQGQGIGVTTLGVGLDYNEDLMTRIANAGNGGYYFVADATKLPAIFTRELHSLMAVVARNAVLKLELGSGVTATRIYGYDAKIGTESTTIPLGDLVGGQVSEVLIKLHHPALSGEHPIAQVELVYQDALQKVAARDQRKISATFVEDHKAVTASIDAATYAKDEEVATAEAVHQAMDAYSRGDKNQAQTIIASRRAAMTSPSAPPAAAPMMKKAKAALDLADDAVAGGGAASQGYLGAQGVSAAAKTVKEESRGLMR